MTPRSDAPGTVRSTPGWAWLAAVPGVAFLAAFAVYPIVVLLRTALGLGRTGLRERPGLTLSFFTDALGSATVRSSLGTSLLVCVPAVAITVVLAVPVVLHAAARSHAGSDTSRLDAFFTLPVALPGTVIGFFTIVLIGNTGLLGLWFEPLRGVSYTVPGLVAAYVYFSLPRVIGPLRGAAEALDPAVPEAARSLGAGRLRVLTTITLPLLAPAIVAATGAALAIALGGYGTIAVLSQGVRLLPLEVVDELSAAGFNVAAASATGVLLAVLAVACLVLGRALSALLARRTAR